MKVIVAIAIVHVLASVVFLRFATAIGESPLVFQLMPYSWIAGPSALLLYGKDCIVSYTVGTTLVSIGVAYAYSSFRRRNFWAGRFLAAVTVACWMLFGFLAYAYWL